MPNRETIIEVRGASFSYPEASGQAVKRVDLCAYRGEFLCVLGRNGSGKSTLAKLLNALFLPSEGSVLVGGIDTKAEGAEFDVRRRCGMVFQNPDNQLVATVVEEDVAFGLENLGVEPMEIRRRVDEALLMVGMSKYARHAPHMLSGGQKQRVAIAGVLAMLPDVIVFDEATAMLDPKGREDVLGIVRMLNRDKGITVVWITHFMEEAALSDRLIVMDAGEVALQGTPREVFAQADRVKALGLDVPPMTALSHLLRERGAKLPESVLSVDEMAGLLSKEAELCSAGEVSNLVRRLETPGANHSAHGANIEAELCSAGEVSNSIRRLETPSANHSAHGAHIEAELCSAGEVSNSVRRLETPGGTSVPHGANIEAELCSAGEVSNLVRRLETPGGTSVPHGANIEIRNLVHTYMEGSPFESTAIRDVTLSIQDGEFIGLIGHTGSGKSTLIQHMNGLLKPNSGTIVVDGHDLMDKGTNLREIRKRVGLVFQYPEYQLFEETAELDIGFGPRNLGLDADEVAARVKEAAALVGLRSELLGKSPFELSGGQKRRCAIAGVLAMKPQLLILDEPTAGLDPKGREDMLKLLSSLHSEQGNTMIMVSHSMSDVARLCGRILVMNEGRLAMDGTPEQVFARGDELVAMGLGLPDGALLARALRDRGFELPQNIWRIFELADAIAPQLKGVSADA